MSARKSSSIWDHFTVDPANCTVAVCKVCDVKLSRGMTAKFFSTSPLIQHLRAKHPEQYQLFADATKAKEEQRERDRVSAATMTRTQAAPKAQGQGQLSLAQSWDRVKPFDINSNEAKRIHYAIGWMLVKDMEPFQIVEKEGFVDLMNTVEKRYTVPSRKYFAEHIIPEMHTQMEESLTKVLDVEVAGNVSCTCDTWTTENTTQSFFGITAHWIAADFSRKSYVLRCMPLDDRHTAEHLATHFLVALDTWHIDKARCHHVVRDNAANIAKCFRDLEISSSGCFAHSLHCSLLLMMAS